MKRPHQRLAEMSGAPGHEDHGVASTPVLEELHGPLAPFGRFTGLERSKIPAPAALPIPLSRIEPIFT
jgi:hypothetical protein